MGFQRCARGDLPLNPVVFAKAQNMLIDACCANVCYGEVMEIQIQIQSGSVLLCLLAGATSNVRLACMLQRLVWPFQVVMAAAAFWMMGLV